MSYNYNAHGRLKSITN
ncbi:hypothetical protein GC096_26065 [Paenibacillus sp. LMG 31461]|uniref:Uncharacterized protein n=1 Tax=Paenibacillus plantarum TaxID=2654975 RepID=A0ABX1XG81_9BACL|nr:hypothetical protein [Paenibacillus plantarum]